MSVTMDEVFDGVMDALAGLFPETPLLGEEPEEEPEAPCFFVKLSPVSQQRETGRRYLRRHTFDLHYYPASGEEHADARQVAEQLYDGLEWIGVDGDPVRGIEMRHEVTEKVLHFFVTYPLHVLKTSEPADVMQQLEQEVTAE